jgi:hypothetical protein
MREKRWARIDALYAQVEELSLRRSFLPPGRFREEMDKAIAARYAEIDKLNEPTFTESGTGQSIALVASVICVVAGFAFRAYPMIVLGVLILLGSLRALGHSPELSKDNIRRWRP